MISPSECQPSESKWRWLCLCDEFLSTWEKSLLITLTFFFPPCCITSTNLKCSFHTIIFQMEGGKNLKLKQTECSKSDLFFSFPQNAIHNNLYSELFCSTTFTCHIISPKKLFSDAGSDDWGTFSLTTPWLTSMRSLRKCVSIHCAELQQKCASV